MDTENPHLLHSSFPKLNQFFKTLKPESSSSSSSFPSKFNAHSLQLGNKMVDQHATQVSDVTILQVNDHDHTQLPSFCKTPKNKGFKIKNFDAIDVEKSSLRGNNNTQKKIIADNNVIELKDDDFDDNDNNCVIVKKEGNSLPRGKNNNDPICVDEYVKSERVPKLDKKVSIGVDRVIHCVDVDDNDDVEIIDVIPFFKNKGDFIGISTTEVGESSGTKRRRNENIVIEIEDPPEEVMFLCEICADSKPKKESFKIMGCSHSYCLDCMKSYVASKLQDGVSKVCCPVPHCDGLLEPEYCRDILPSEVFSRWGNLLCESVLLATQKFYCPFKDCSALMIDDGDESVTQAECPTCNRLFCAKCKVGWHDGIECTEFQNLSKDERQKEDLMLRKLASKQKWQRCPTCKFFVEKSEGCLYMKCRCGIAFCYSCGAINHDHRYHYCKKCGR